MDSGWVGLVSATYKIGWSPGLSLMYVGGLGISAGSCLSVCDIADCTSCAAESISRSRLNCKVMAVVPSALEEVMVSRPAMVENCFSNGVATAEAMVSGLAPGRPACT